MARASGEGGNGGGWGVVGGAVIGVGKNMGAGDYGRRGTVLRIGWAYREGEDALAGCDGQWVVPDLPLHEPAPLLPEVVLP